MRGLARRLFVFFSKRRATLLAMTIVFGMTAVGLGLIAAREDDGVLSRRSHSLHGGSLKGDIALKHDFGFVRADTSRTHVFVLQNETAATWALESVESSCNCAVAAVDPHIIAPGATLRIGVKYQAGAKNVDDQKTVTVRFRDSAAPRVFLTVAAQVRRPLSILPESVVLPGVARGMSAEGDFIVANFSHTKWETIKISHAADWLTTTTIPLESQRERPAGAKQAWRVLVRGDTRNMDYGRQAASLGVRTTVYGGGTRTGDVTVRFDVQTPVAAIPSELFLPKTEQGIPSTTTILLRFAESSKPESTDMVGLRHDLGDQLRLRWAEPSGRFWKLEATLTPQEASAKYIKGTVQIIFDGDLPDLDVPIRALVQTPSMTP